MHRRDPRLEGRVLAERMLIVSAVVHHRWEGRLYGYTPYVREIDAWSHMFDQIRIAGPVADGPPPDDCAPFSSGNIAIRGLPATGGDTWPTKLAQVLRVPQLVTLLALQMAWADAIQVRCPSNLGVLAVPLAPMFSRRLHCKYAGMWRAFPGEPASSRFQRAALRSWWWRGPVNAYGPLPSDPPKIHASFSTALTEAELSVPRSAATRTDGSTLRVLFVGRLTDAKNVDVLIRSISEARLAGIPCALEVIGDGPARAALEALAESLTLHDCVEFRRALPTDDVLEAYRRSDVLALVSESEGWPKALVEAMAFGVAVIGNDRGLVPTILGNGRGRTVPPGDADALGRAIVELATDDDARRSMTTRASAWARRFSLEHYADDLQDVLRSEWPRR